MLLAGNTGAASTGAHHLQGSVQGSGELAVEEQLKACRTFFVDWTPFTETITMSPTERLKLDIAGALESNMWIEARGHTFPVCLRALK